MRILLAPMEGLADDLLRGILTAVGGYDLCVSEFLRVSGTLLPRRAFVRLAPELAQGARTAAGTPLRLQLLGSDASCLAENAARAAEFSPFGIDLNFGCPAPLVNRHGGGAALLAHPEQLCAIVTAVRRAVPKAIPVTAKMRLGLHHPEEALVIASALAAGGADELVVHARTRADAYSRPARWEWLARIREAVRVPVIANGDIWSRADYDACRRISGCGDVMLGRGAVADPFLAQRLRGREPALGQAALAPMLDTYWQAVQRKVTPRHAPGRLKAWLVWLARGDAWARELHDRIRPLRDPAAIGMVLQAAALPP